ncbi:MAG: hypothetical protein AAGA01_13925 [Cyanobacteria bacterium P01_E01_bin.43]
MWVCSQTSLEHPPSSVQPPQAQGQSFGHLADFCGTASPELAAEFWQQIGTLALNRLQNGQSAWCNTHGHGVPCWLHVRFDNNHKYASFPPYGAITSSSQQEWYTLYDRAFGVHNSHL